MAVENNSTVRWYASWMPDAPQINGTPGELINIIDACLIDGFGVKAPDGNKISVNSGVATVEFSSGHEFEKHTIIEIEGATPAALNDVWRVTGTTATTFTFNCPGIPDGIASGSISVKRATPGYWQKVFSDGSTLAAYRSSHPESNQFFLRILDDMDATNARGYATMKAYEIMTDINNGTGEFPVGHCGWVKWFSSSDAQNERIPWMLVADGKTVYFFIKNNGYNYTASYFCPYVFGDFASADDDIKACILTGTTSTSPATPFANYSASQWEGTYDTGINVADTYPAIGSPITTRMFANGMVKPTSTNGGDNFPSLLTGGHLFSTGIFLLTGTTGPIRGMLRGLYPSMIIGGQILGDPTEGKNVSVLEPTPQQPKPMLLAGWFLAGIGIDLGGPW